MSDILARWNASGFEQAVQQILPCCGSMAWARRMASRRPIENEDALIAASDAAWRSLQESDWMEAFDSHPRIGESGAANVSDQRPSSLSLDWALQEQKQVADAGDAIKIALREGNHEYENKFGRIFIVCAAGKSAAELLEILRRRLQNDAGTELYAAAEQQRQINQIRLRKWLQG